jgi:hypothetical protein
MALVGREGGTIGAIWLQEDTGLFAIGVSYSWCTFIWLIRLRHRHFYQRDKFSASSCLEALDDIHYHGLTPAEDYAL